MKEVLFRGRLIDSGTWVYGSLFNSIWRKSADGSRVCYIFPDNMLDDDNGCGDSWDDFASVADQYEVDPATVGQYTGLKDKNGKNIFEGDVVTYGDDGFLTAMVRFGKFNEYGRGTVPSYSYGWHLDAIQCQGEEHAVQQPLSEYEGVLTYWPAHVADTKAGIERLKVEVIGNVYDNPELLKVE